MAFKDYDVFIIGTGTAGKNVAKACASAGLTVGMADNREYGGTCANAGCDPKKVLLGVTEILEKAEKMLGKGITKLPGISWEDLMLFKYTFVDAVPAATEKNLKDLGIDLYHQSPKFLDEQTLSVEGKTISATNIVIATGQVPMELPIPGRELALISDDFLNLKELPKSMIFIGAGYIGMEFAHLAARFGVEVTMLDFAPRPLMNFDEDLVNLLVKTSENLGIKFHFNAEVSGIEKLRKNFRVKANQGGREISVKAEMLFNTAGRVPSIADLDLEKGNVAFSKKGVSVNDFLQNITNKNVFACGDVSDSAGLALTPLSSLEADVVAHNLLNKKMKKAVYPAQPSVVFTLPNLASVGILEAEAKEKGHEIIIEHKEVADWFNAKRINEKVYAYKTIVDKKTGLILGAHLIGPEAAEVINLFAMAINTKTDHETLKEMIFAYPTWGNDVKGMV
ncbi:NAD(P)/FAD-dependent oxidoreductase [Antarcticibacterium arcticum]|uniref:Dihydrolipoyl dehydrogenase n=1 Tax=Antarcticibacterium arcticum TaxID=2585771 RepID=A0A5B8YN34_9FLAO|nr:NAD(P)/FAD-dependent oxidoreductase [Antarcticibacterium arcticum]QED38688.1 NAD(P)/FAD-dependent oxidoreductase [Antarcticibacterium arcticum]